MKPFFSKNKIMSMSVAFTVALSMAYCGGSSGGDDSSASSSPTVGTYSAKVIPQNISVNTPSSVKGAGLSTGSYQFAAIANGDSCDMATFDYTANPDYMCLPADMTNPAAGGVVAHIDCMGAMDAESMGGQEPAPETTAGAPSGAYQELKTLIKQTEERAGEVKIEMMLMDQVLTQVKADATKCTSYPCTVAQDSLNVTFTEEMRQAMKSVFFPDTGDLPAGCPAAANPLNMLPAAGTPIGNPELCIKNDTSSTAEYNWTIAYKPMSLGGEGGAGGSTNGTIDETGCGTGYETRIRWSDDDDGSLDDETVELTRGFEDTFKDFDGVTDITIKGGFSFKYNGNTKAMTFKDLFKDTYGEFSYSAGIKECDATTAATAGEECITFTGKMGSKMTMKEDLGSGLDTTFSAEDTNTMEGMASKDGGFMKSESSSKMEDNIDNTGSTDPMVNKDSSYDTSTYDYIFKYRFKEKFDGTGKVISGAQSYWDGSAWTAEAALSGVPLPPASGDTFVDGVNAGVDVGQPASLTAFTGVPNMPTAIDSPPLEIWLTPISATVDDAYYNNIGQIIAYHDGTSTDNGYGAGVVVDFFYWGPEVTGTQTMGSEFSAYSLSGFDAGTGTPTFTLVETGSITLGAPAGT